MTSGIYKIILNGKDYIGSAKDIKDRIRRHLGELNNNNHGNNRLQRAFNKHGVESFEYVVLEETCIFDLIKREQFYIDENKPYYNICKTAGSTLGRMHSDKTKAYLSKIKKGKQPSLGRILSQETKDKISAKAKQRGLHPFFRLASIKANTGRKQSAEEIHRRSLTQMKLSHSDVADIKIRFSLGLRQADLAKEYGVSQTVISRAVTGKGIYNDFMQQPKLSEDYMYPPMEQIGF